jgi:hypothetical protein
VRGSRAVCAPLIAALQPIDRFDVRGSFPLQIADVAVQDSADAQVGDKQV